MRMIRRKRYAAAAILTAASLSLAACGSTSSGSGGSSGSSDKVITANSTEPQNPLIPADTNEQGGGNLVALLFTGLVTYASDGKLQYEGATSITSKDNKTWTVKLADKKFSDGTPITAKNYVDAWNFSANPTNKFLSASYYNQIVGTDDAGGTLLKGEKAMSGLKVINDKTFTITIKQPDAEFPTTLGYSAFAPLPESALTNIKAYGQKPIGNGPYVLKKWTHNVKAELVPNKNYSGNDKPKNGGVTFVFYTDTNSAYSDVQAGNLDVLDTVPTGKLSTFKKDSSVQAVNEEGASIATITIPVWLKGFGEDKAGKLRRAALSMAIDRNQIDSKLFFGTHPAAKDFSSPKLPGFTTDLANESNLTFDKAKAKQLWAEANKIQPWSGTVTLSYNADGDHKPWVTAVVNQWVNNLGIKATAGAIPTFDQFRTKITDRTLKTAFRTGWYPDYPLISNYLVQVFGTKAGANDADYSNKQFDALMAKAATTADDSARYKLIAQAQGILLGDLPAIPLWNYGATGVAAKGVKGFTFNWQSRPDYWAIYK